MTSEFPLNASPAWAEPLLRGQGKLLERLAAGAPLSQILEELCLLVEFHLPGRTCAILLVDPPERFRLGAAPSLPELFRNGVAGSALGPGTTPCGLAASLGREVLIRDLQTDPAWRQAAPLAKALSLRGCVSLPILGGGPNPLGTFALYETQGNDIPESDLGLLRACVGLASIAIRHHQREASAEDSRERFRILCEYVGQLVYDRNLETNTLEWAGPVERLIGVSPEAFQEEGFAGWAQRIHPEDRTEVLAHLERSKNHLLPFATTYRFLKADGSYLHVEDRGAFIPAHDHPRMIGVMTDITSDTQAEARYQELVESLAEGIAIVDGEEAFEFANPAAHAVFGVETGALPGRVLTDFLEPDQLGILHSQTRHRQAGHQSTYELQIHRPSGEIRTLAVNAVPRLPKDGAYAGAFVVFLDITDRVEAEAALRRSENRFRRLFEAIPLGVVIHREGRVQYVNPATAKAVGLAAPQDAVGRVIRDFLPPEDLQITMQRLKVLMEGGEVPWIEMHHLRADGTPFPVESRMMRLEGEDNPVLLSVFQDITERKLAEESLRQAQKLESLGVLAGGIAHDFNNLLTAMLGNLNLAQMAVAPESRATTFLDHLERAILKASELTHQMLAYSGRGRFVVHALDLNRVVQEMAGLLTVSISKKISLQFQLHPDLPLIEADAAQIQQVAMNLVLNASEAIGNAVGTISITTSVLELTQIELNQEFPGQDLRPGRHVLLEVRDTGCGMSPEVARKIFDPFFTTKSNGRGLGLSAMQGILRGHHAGIRLHSDPGAGTTFSIFFQASSIVEPTLPEGNPEATLPPTHGCILLVDDEESVRSTLRAMLEGLGYEVLEASDGVEGLEAFQRHRARLSGMLLDLTMPRMDGKETLRQLRTLAPAFPVLLNSGYDEGEALVPLLKLGPSAFIQKPYSLSALQAALNGLLRRR